MPPAAQHWLGSRPDAPAYNRRGGGPSLVGRGLGGAEVFCSTVQAWVGGSIVSIDGDSVTVEFDLDVGLCRKKLRSDSQNLRLPSAERRQLRAFREPEDSDALEAEGIAEQPLHLRRAGELGGTLRSKESEEGLPEPREQEESEESSSEFREEGAGGSSLEEIDPGANFLPGEATTHVLNHVFVKRGGEEPQGLDCDGCCRSSPSMLLTLAARVFGGHRCSELRHAGKSPLPLKLYQNNSYVIAQPFREPVEVQYHGPEGGDILLKFYILEGGRHDDWAEYTLVGQEDGTPAFIHSRYRRAPVRVPRAPGGGPFFLGIMVHRDLNADWLWKMGDDDLRRQFMRSTAGGWRARGDAEGRKSAQEADYILSWATADRDHNNPLLKRLSQEPVRGPHSWWPRPITFCTDRSLGFGQHLMAEAVDAETKVNLYLAKHGFGKPVEQGVWFQDFLKAIEEVRCGMLVVYVSDEYLESLACLRECATIPQEKVFVLHLEQDGSPLICSLDDALRSQDFRLQCLAEKVNHQRRQAEKTRRQGEDGVAELRAGNRAVQRAVDLQEAAYDCIEEEGPSVRAVGLLEEAEGILEGCGSLDPERLVDIAELHIALGDAAGAEAPLDRAAARFSQNERYRKPYLRERLALCRGMLCLSLRQLDGVLDWLCRLAAVRILPSRLESFKTMVDKGVGKPPDRQAALRFFAQLLREFWQQWDWLPAAVVGRASLENLERELLPPATGCLAIPAEFFAFEGWRSPHSDPYALSAEARSCGWID